MFALAPGKGFLAYRGRGGTLHTYVQLKAPQDWLADADVADGASVSARVVAEFDGWAPDLTALITDSDTAPGTRPLYTLPTGHRWARVPGVPLGRRGPWPDPRLAPTEIMQVRVQLCSFLAMLAGSPRSPY
jgi:hypothetical protein